MTEQGIRGELRPFACAAGLALAIAAAGLLRSCADADVPLRAPHSAPAPGAATRGSTVGTLAPSFSPMPLPDCAVSVGGNRLPEPQDDAHPWWDEEQDPYELHQVTILPGADEGLIHSTTSDLRTGADDDQAFAEKLGGAFLAEDAAPPDDSPSGAIVAPLSR